MKNIFDKMTGKIKKDNCENKPNFFKNVPECYFLKYLFTYLFVNTNSNTFSPKKIRVCKEKHLNLKNFEIRIVITKLKFFAQIRKCLRKMLQ